MCGSKRNCGLSEMKNNSQGVRGSNTERKTEKGTQKVTARETKTSRHTEKET